MKTPEKLSRMESVLIAQKIIETCNTYSLKQCIQCPFASTREDEDCWLEGLKVNIEELEGMREIENEFPEQLNLDLKSDFKLGANSLDESYRKYKETIERVAKDGINIPLHEYAMLTEECLSFLSIVKELNISVLIGASITDMLSKR